MIKRRNLGLQVLWYVLTFGIYSVYWFYVTCEEMSQHLGRKDSVGLWCLLYLLPPACLYSMYKQGELYEILSDKAVERWVILLLWIVFPPAVWFIIQRKLNELADSQAAGPALPPSQL
jgi:hypothetical protein